MSNGRNFFSKYKIFIDLLVSLISLFPKNFRKFVFIKLRYMGGKIGVLLRYVFLKTIAIELGDNVSIFEGVFLLNVENISIGNNVSIHPMSYIEGYGGLKIGDNVSIAHATTLLTVKHNFGDEVVPIKYQGLDARPLIIEDNVWLGAKATILGGNVVRSGTIIAAGAVVTSDTENNYIYSGIPAKKLKHRFET